MEGLVNFTPSQMFKPVEIKKGSNLLKPLLVLCDPDRTQTCDLLLRRPMATNFIFIIH